MGEAAATERFKKQDDSIEVRSISSASSDSSDSSDVEITGGEHKGDLMQMRTYTKQRNNELTSLARDVFARIANSRSDSSKVEVTGSENHGDLMQRNSNKLSGVARDVFARIENSRIQDASANPTNHQASGSGENSRWAALKARIAQRSSGVPMDASSEGKSQVSEPDASLHEGQSPAENSDVCNSMENVPSASALPTSSDRFQEGTEQTRTRAGHMRK